jgi:hypothetical protein
MARNAKADDNIQVFRGSLPKPDVFALNSGTGCCGSGLSVSYDKLAERTRFDNALAHSNPLGANDKYRFPGGNGFSDERAAIIAHINQFGVGAQISVLAIPTYAFVKGIAVHVGAEESGLTFNLITRNGLAIPAAQEIQVATAAGTGGSCDVTRTQTAPATPFVGFGALGVNLFIDLFSYDGAGVFSLEADELILEVATMPADPVVGLFDLTVAVNYEVLNRAEQ